ncbi:hypothetical protein COT29_01265 [Candidatus Micrarchaeota archaeon CG08_land_8_20_14_0_20_59_11]|nr:MAG: hypothetical protein COT29_01265 [Candidatus Micrarchaeota archaeon CG08_land_8_20_14_0_20_59_11]
MVVLHLPEERLIELDKLVETHNRAGLLSACDKFTDLGKGTELFSGGNPKKLSEFLKNYRAVGEFFVRDEKKPKARTLYNDLILWARIRSRQKGKEYLKGFTGSPENREKLLGVVGWAMWADGERRQGERKRQFSKGVRDNGRSTG